MRTGSPLAVRGLTAYPLSAASARVRVGNFIPFLAEHDVKLTHQPALDDAEYAQLKSDVRPSRKAGLLLRSGARAALRRYADELLLVQRMALLTPFPGVDPPRRLDVYDFDDALLVGSPADANRRFQWVKRERQRVTASMRRARLVIAGNPYLAGEATALNKRVEVVPSCVDPSIQPLHSHTEADSVTIGWIGSHTTVQYLHPVLPVIAGLNDSGHRAKLLVIGADTGLQADWIEQRPWSLARQAADIAEMDIGIMPLPDTPWTRGKSGYKLLQYFAAGIPAVGSPVGINSALLEGAQSYAATGPDEWQASLRSLIHDVTDRRDRGSAARGYVEKHYSYQRWAPELATLLRSLAR